MRLARRHAIAGLTTALPALLLAPRRTLADAPDPRMAERSLGRPDAKVVVQEWFSLTCTHCARFSQVVFPEIRAKLIDTGLIRYVFRDYPLDQVALAAAMAARALPAGRYLPFVDALFAGQDRWAFTRDDPIAALGRMAALAGLSPDAFRRTLDDAGLRQAILAAQDRGQAQYRITGTPTFVFGDMADGLVGDYDTFARRVAEAAARADAGTGAKADAGGSAGAGAGAGTGSGG